MRFAGRVVNGRVEVDAKLPEGEVVTVIVGDDDEAYELTEEEEEDLWQAWQEVERGEFISSDDLLAELRNLRDR